MDLFGLGDEIIEDFYNYGYLKEITDFYELSKYYDKGNNQECSWSY